MQKLRTKAASLIADAAKKTWDFVGLSTDEIA